MNRYFLPADAWEENTLVLTGDEARHCARVMREREGNRIEVFDGAGTFADCRIIETGRDQVRCDINSRGTQARPPHPVTLCQAIPKGGNMELIVQKSVELGVAAIQPLITAHTVARPESLGKKQAKWQRIALEACKQCGQNHLPEVREVLPFNTWLEQQQPAATCLIAALDPSARHLKTIFNAAPPEGDINLLIGPEGDFSPVEYASAFNAGYQAVSFGKIILRVETASLYGLSILQHELSAR